MSDFQEVRHARDNAAHLTPHRYTYRTDFRAKIQVDVQPCAWFQNCYTPSKIECSLSECPLTMRPAFTFCFLLGFAFGAPAQQTETGAPTLTVRSTLVLARSGEDQGRTSDL